MKYFFSATKIRNYAVRLKEIIYNYLREIMRKYSIV